MSSVSFSTLSGLPTYIQQPSLQPSLQVNLPTLSDSGHWHERLIAQLNHWDAALEAHLPNVVLQDNIDALGCYIEEQFAPLQEFNVWLNSNGQGTWYLQLATCLAKLPVRAARNIVQLMYNVIQGILYTAVHPCKALNHLAQQIVSLAHALTQPETWSKIGAGAMGTACGQALITGLPLSVIGMGIGGAMTIAALSMGALKAALYADNHSKLDAAAENFSTQIKQLPESLLTGLFLRVLIGGIQRSLQKSREPSLDNSDREASFHRSSREELINNIPKAEQFIQEHNLPTCSSITSDGTGKVMMRWEGEQLAAFKKSYSHVFIKSQAPAPTSVKIELPATGTPTHLAIRYQGVVRSPSHGFETVDYTRQVPISSLKR